jgi:hypothetical protein
VVLEAPLSNVTTGRNINTVTTLAAMANALRNVGQRMGRA